MLFSVLIASYNNGKYMQECIDSILKQTYQNFEIVIVDDCSTDDSWKFITELSHLYDFVRIFKNEDNRGCGYTKRKCIEYATGDIAGFVDPDDALVPNALELMYRAHLAYPKASLVHSNYYKYSGDFSDKAPVKGNGAAMLPGDSLLYVCTVTHFSSFKINLYRQTVGLNASYKRAVDMDLYLLMEECGEFIFLDEALYMYRSHDHNISISGNEWRASYWHFVARLDACKRRGINPEDMYMNQKMIEHSFFQNRVRMACDSIYNGWSYKIGRVLTYPLRIIFNN